MELFFLLISCFDFLFATSVAGTDCVRSVLASSVKILPYRPPTRLIRTKYRVKYSVFAYEILKALCMHYCHERKKAPPVKFL